MLRGKPREFWVGLILTIVTFGIYSCVWHYVAFKELYDQEEREDFPLAFYICTYIPGISVIFQILYMLKNFELITSLRERYGLPQAIGLGEFLLWVTLGQLIVVGPLIAYYKLQGSINELWTAYEHLQNPARTPAAFAAE